MRNNFESKKVYFMVMTALIGCVTSLTNSSGRAAPRRLTYDDSCSVGGADYGENQYCEDADLKEPPYNNCPAGTDCYGCKVLLPADAVCQVTQRTGEFNTCSTAFDGVCQESIAISDETCDRRTDCSDCVAAGYYTASCFGACADDTDFTDYVGAESCAEWAAFWEDPDNGSCDTIYTGYEDEMANIRNACPVTCGVCVSERIVFAWPSMPDTC